MPGAQRTAENLLKSSESSCRLIVEIRPKPLTIYKTNQMQKYRSLGAAAALLIFTACNNADRKPGDVVIKSDDGTTQTVINPSAIEQTADQFTKKAEDLAKLQPYSTDQLKSITPEEFGGAKRSSYSAQNTIGVAMVEAEYRLNDTASYELTIIDCAGEAGSGFFGVQYLSLMDSQTETDEMEARSIDWNGGRAYQEYDKVNHHSKLTWLAGDRVLVAAKGKNMKLDVLMSAAKNLILPLP